MTMKHCVLWLYTLAFLLYDHMLPYKYSTDLPRIFYIVGYTLCILSALKTLDSGLVGFHSWCYIGLPFTFWICSRRSVHCCIRLFTTLGLNHDKWRFLSPAPLSFTISFHYRFTPGPTNRSHVAGGWRGSEWWRERYVAPGAQRIYLIK